MLIEMLKMFYYKVESIDQNQNVYAPAIDNAQQTKHFIIYTIGIT